MFGVGSSHFARFIAAIPVSGHANRQAMVQNENCERAGKMYQPPPNTPVIANIEIIVPTTLSTPLN